MFAHGNTKYDGIVSVVDRLYFFVFIFLKAFIKLFWFDGNRFTYRISMQYLPFMYRRPKYYSLYKANWRFVVFRNTKCETSKHDSFSIRRFIRSFVTTVRLKCHPLETVANSKSTIILLSTLTPIINCFNLFIFCVSLFFLFILNGILME